MKNFYCTLDTETFGGAANPKGIYHLGGLIHDRMGNVVAPFNYLIAEHYGEIQKDDYAKRNFDRYAAMVADGIVTMIATEREAVAAVDNLCDMFNVRYMTAFNTGFDFTKTLCRDLLADREFIDIYLMAVQTLGQLKKYAAYCRENGLRTASKKSVATSAEAFYSYLTGNPAYVEEHTALEDAKIEKDIFLACLRTHKAFTKNIHFYDYCVANKAWGMIPRWAV